MSENTNTNEKAQLTSDEKRQAIRELLERGKKEGCEVLFPQPVYCTDNAVMIASRGYFSIREGKDLADLSLNAQPSLRTGV